jgi:hypothetical protein
MQRCKPYLPELLFCCLALCLACITPPSAQAQKTLVLDSSKPSVRTVLAGAEYNRGAFHQKMWGKDYRREWTTPVTVPVLNLDSAFGGLTAVRQDAKHPRILYLHNPEGKAFILRTVNRTYLDTLPKIMDGTFVQRLANDQTSTLHPFAAIAIPQLSEAAGVFHTDPKFYFVPHHPRLNRYNTLFANSLCLLEEWPENSQTGFEGFGRPDAIVDTKELLALLEENNKHQVDQEAYVKARLFDMLVGDWGRREENWMWGAFTKGPVVVYKPIPKERDQAFAKFEGTLLSLVLRLGKYRELQTFGDDIKNIRWYNYPAYGMDKRFTNALPLDDWQAAARTLQRSLTDKVIEEAVRNMPPEIFALSGNEIIRKLKARRNRLAQWADEYYHFLAEDVEIPGSRQKELFDVKRVTSAETQVNVYRQDGPTRWQKTPVYSRRFFQRETKELRIYGSGGDDLFQVNGSVQEGMQIKLFGGKGQDSLIDRSFVSIGNKKMRFYDTEKPGGIYEPKRLRLTNDTALTSYAPEAFNYDSRGLRPIFYYNRFYRFYVGLGYTITRNRTRTGDFTQKHSFGINYSIIENSLHPYYKGIFNRVAGQWNLYVNAGFDGVRRYNFFGIGNETKAEQDRISYYWTRISTLYTEVGLGRNFGPYHAIRFDWMYQGAKTLENKDGYTNKKNATAPLDAFNWKHFAGPQASYTYVRTNDVVIPTRGLIAQAFASYTNNLQQWNRSVTKVSGSINWYWPIVKSFSFAIKTGAAHLWGEPEFYQMNMLGGYYDLRGFWRYRFYGRTSFYNQNELRWLPNIRSRIFAGRVGLLALFDQGRVWADGEVSHKWHRAFGGGIILVPFNKFSVTVTQSFSEEGRRSNIRLGRLF